MSAARPANSVGITFVVAAATAGAIAIAVACYSRQPQENGNSDKDEKKKRFGFEEYDNNENDGLPKNTIIDLPPHIQREIHKEKRRKLSVRFLAMKKPMYDNIEMFSPDGDLLCTISLKKANWYITKELAEWKEEGVKLQLLFEPKNGETVKNTKYTISQKENKCVSCGDDRSYMRHYIVPYSYRATLPEKFKSHMPHDIVLLCPDCQLTSEQATQRRQKKLESVLRKDPSTALAVLPCRDLYKAKSGALALLQHGDKIPSSRKRQLEEIVLEHHCKEMEKDGNQAGDEQRSDDDVLNESLLQKYGNMETHIPNPSYIPGADLVAEQLNGDDDAIEAFIRDWRRHFLETMNPRFLPKGWGLDHPVHSDSR